MEVTNNSRKRKLSSKFNYTFHPVSDESTNGLMKKKGSAKLEFSIPTTPKSVSRNRTKSAKEPEEISLPSKKRIRKSSNLSGNPRSKGKIQESLMKTESEKNKNLHEFQNSDTHLCTKSKGKSNVNSKTKIKKFEPTNEGLSSENRSSAPRFSTDMSPDLLANTSESKGSYSSKTRSQKNKKFQNSDTQSDTHSSTKSKGKSNVKIKKHEPTNESASSENLSRAPGFSTDMSPDLLADTSESKGTYSNKTQSEKNKKFQNSYTHSRTKSKGKSNVKSKTKIKKLEPTNEGAPSPDLLADTSESKDNYSNKTGKKESRTSSISYSKQPLTDIDAVKEEFFAALKKSVENTVPDKPQPNTSTGTIPGFELPSGEKLIRFYEDIRAAAKKAVKNVNPKDCENFNLQISYCNLNVFTEWNFNKHVKETNIKR